MITRSGHTVSVHKMNPNQLPGEVFKDTTVCLMHVLLFFLFCLHFAFSGVFQMTSC